MFSIKGSPVNWILVNYQLTFGNSRGNSKVPKGEIGNVSGDERKITQLEELKKLIYTHTDIYLLLFEKYISIKRI